MFDCLTRKGWDVTLDDTGGVEASVANDQFAQYMKDNDECSVAVGADGDGSVSDEKLQAFYDDRVSVRECLITAGYPVGEVPSFQAFKDSYETDPWDPYDQVSQSEANAAVSACPQSAIL